MIEVVIKHKKPNEIMDIVRELRSQGIIQGHDFNFAYHQAKYNNDGWECVIPEHTVFSFYTEKYATFFALKYAT